MASTTIAGSLAPTLALTAGSAKARPAARAAAAGPRAPLRLRQQAPCLVRAQASSTSEGRSVREGKVTNVAARELGALQKQGWVVLDVRPDFEHDKAPVAGAVNIPTYVGDDSASVGNFLAQWAFAGMGGGWWNGGKHTKPNPDFMPAVLAQVPKDKGVVVVCQKGLRSLSAAEALSRNGYGRVSWVSGGLDNTRPGDVETTNGADVRMGGIGGVSEMLGWTEVQREREEGFGGGPFGVIKIFAVILAVDLAWAGYEFFFNRIPQ